MGRKKIAEKNKKMGTKKRLFDDSDSVSKDTNDPIWRGCFNICNGSIDIVDGPVAYLSSKACSRVSDMARSLPASLSGVTLHKLHVWPKQFDELLPTKDDIGFYFLPASERFKEAYNNLLADLGSKDYALKFVIGNAELLVFTSLELQLESQRIQGKFYIWGLFRRKKVNSSLVDGSFPHEQGNLRGIQHSDSAAAVDAGKERNYTEGFYLPHPTGPSSDEEGATDIVKMAEASQKLKERQRSHIKKKACPINPSTSLTGEAFVEDTASSGTGTSWQETEIELHYEVREVLNQCTSMTEMKKRMEEQSRNGRQVSGVFREVNNGAIIKEIKATRKGAVGVRKLDFIAEKERDRGIRKGTIAEKSTEITTAACAINHEETTKHGKGVLEIESHGIEGRPSDAAFVPQGPAEAIDQEASMVPSSMMHEQTMIDITQQHVAYEKQKYPIEADRLGNENMHMVDDIDRFIDKLVNISRAHRAVALQSAPPSFSISAAPDLQAPDVNLRKENKKADASHELVNSDKINHSDYEHVGPYLVQSYAATILRSIFNQYGDIAQDCPLSISMRCRLLEGLCLELKKVLSIVPENLQHHHLETLDSVIGEAESEQLNVKWLCDWHAKLKRIVALHQHYEKIKRNLAMVDESPITLRPESSMLMNLKYDIQLLRSESIALEEDMRNRETITSPVLKYASKLKRFCDRVLAKVTNVFYTWNDLMLIVLVSSLMIISSFYLSPAIAFLPNSRKTLTMPDSTLNFTSGHTTWTNNNVSLPHEAKFRGNSLARFILFKEVTGPLSGDGRYGFGFGFFCHWPFHGYCDLSILFVEMPFGTISKTRPEVFWSANWNRPLKENATLEFSNGNLLLIDEKGQEIIWSSQTSGMSTFGMKIDENGNLVLFNKHFEAVWKSSNHPTDTLLLGQVIRENQKLTSRITSVNESQGLFYLSMATPSMVAYLVGEKPSAYLTTFPFVMISPSNHSTDDISLLKMGGNIGFYHQKFSKSDLPFPVVYILRLDVDGGFRVYGWYPGDKWKIIHFWPNLSDECWAPLKCGRYGVCSKKGKCNCPVSVGPNATDYFAQNQDSNGCHEINPPEGTIPNYEMVYFGNLSYFGSFGPMMNIFNLVDPNNPINVVISPNGYVEEFSNEESCKQACQNDISCKAAFFVMEKSTSKGFCYLPSEILSIMGNPDEEHYNVSAYLKVNVPKPVPETPNQENTNTLHHSKRLRLSLLAISAFLVTIIILVSIICFLLRRKVIKCAAFACKQPQDHLKTVISGTLTSFSYSELSLATAKFAKRLGGGGFGAVYKGILKDGTMVAVKRLESNGQGMEEFLAEVDTLGNIHHINLVKLIGFCVEKRHRILVYEYMSKGSLDKWIFHENGTSSILAWNTRKKIVLDIAKGLAYLHGDCRQRIAHLDVKPQNILLDDNFNAKISDFGLSKLINRDDSQVVTRMRGTPGYIAPEWQNARITVSADIYSFGIVVLEVVTGRKILDYSQPDSDVCLLNQLKKKCLENRLMGMIDLTIEDLVQHYEEVFAMIMVGLWCVNEDYTRRPSMYSVVKLLEEEKMPQLDCPSRFPSSTISSFKL
ncbi:hypothetical protein CCACVL1_15866 [Corchorus capsularis]|uniref:non-specific serine/threonine protein kinase n=1 Tax=Corchorus capsularis TaxID=210143 RepID=A0A1R3I0Y6_COCAP|nr:hypothetical protein CCACVL1_15866 [Corchorus capsularis]